MILKENQEKIHRLCVYRLENDLLAETLRRLRENSGLTQRGLAYKLGKSQSFVAKIELAMQPIYVWELFDWCAAVGVTPSSVLAEVESLL